MRTNQNLIILMLDESNLETNVNGIVSIRLWARPSDQYVLSIGIRITWQRKKLYWIIFLLFQFECRQFFIGIMAAVMTLHYRERTFRTYFICLRTHSLCSRKWKTKIYNNRQQQRHRLLYFGMRFASAHERPATNANKQHALSVLRSVVGCTEYDTEIVITNT